MAYDPPADSSIFVDIAFIALDAENLCETSNDKFTTDFGDNKFPYYKGRASQHHQQHLEEENEDDSNQETNVAAVAGGAQEIYHFLPTIYLYLPINYPVFTLVFTQYLQSIYLVFTHYLLCLSLFTHYSLFCTISKQ